MILLCDGDTTHRGRVPTCVTSTNASGKNVNDFWEQFHWLTIGVIVFVQVRCHIRASFFGSLCSRKILQCQPDITEVWNRTLPNRF